MDEPALDGPVSAAGELKARLDAERRGAPFLVYRDDTDRQYLMDLEDADSCLTVGRGRDSDLPLSWDREVSRLHAQLERMGHDWTLVDEGLSRNGSYVNGERVTGRRRLRDGDRLCFGTTAVIYRRPTLDPSESTDIGVTAASVSLSPTQRNVLVALCRPLGRSAFESPATNRDIAGELNLSVDAVKAHLRVLFERFGLEQLPQNQKRARLAATALVNRIVVPHDL
jgi:pSer/pThr/pTyr-binding forkhead associated (FHA) protein